MRRVHALALHEVRRRVLRGDNPDISVADPRDEEPTAVHVAGFLATRLVVTSSWYPSVAPMNPHLVTYQLRYMATDFDVQGRGYGSVVLEAAEEALRELGAEQVWAVIATRRWGSTARPAGRPSRAPSTSAPRPSFLIRSSTSS